MVPKLEIPKILKDIERLKAEVTKLKDENRDQYNLIAKLKEDNARLRDSLSALSMNLDATKTDVGKLKVSDDKQNSMIATLMDEDKKIYEKLTPLPDKIRENRDLIGRLMPRVSEAIKTSDNASMRVTKVETDVRVFKDKMDKEIYPWLKRHDSDVASLREVSRMYGERISGLERRPVLTSPMIEGAMLAFNNRTTLGGLINLVTVRDAPLPGNLAENLRKRLDDWFTYTSTVYSIRDEHRAVLESLKKYTTEISGRVSALNGDFKHLRDVEYIGFKSKILESVGGLRDLLTDAKGKIDDMKSRFEGIRDRFEGLRRDFRIWADDMFTGGPDGIRPSLKDWAMNLIRYVIDPYFPGIRDGFTHLALRHSELSRVIATRLVTIKKPIG